MQEAAEVATALQLGVKALQFYTADHPRVSTAMAHLEQACATMLKLRSRISLTAAKGGMLVDGEPIAVVSPHCRALAAELERRHIGGVVFAAGVRRRDLLELVRVLTLRPEQIKSAGGADALLQSAGAEYVRFSHVRYEAVTEGEEVVWSNSLRRAAAGGPSSAEALPALLQQYLLERAQAPSAQPGVAHSGVAQPGVAHSGVAQAGEGQPGVAQPGVAQSGVAQPGEHAAGVIASADAAADILRQLLAGMDSTAQLALLMRVKQLPEGDDRDTFRSAAVGPMRALLSTLTTNDEEVHLLNERLRDMGVSREQLDELLSVMAWDKLPVDQRIAKLLEGTHIFDFPADKFLRFVRQLLESQRTADVHQLLTRYISGFTEDSLYVRRTVCDTLGQIALFIKSPGLPRDLEQVVGAAILNQFVLETDASMRTALTGAASNFIAMLIGTGRSEPAVRVVARLDLMGAAAAQSLAESFGEAHRAAELVAQSVTADPDSLSRVVLPLVTRLGGAATPAFIEALSSEEDRNRRGRLVKALKAIGDPAFPHLLNALRSPTWFVVRNTINVLGDIGGPEHAGAIGKRLLDHGEPRVRRAAARALSRIGGSEAESLLVTAVHDKDEETQAEVLLCLGSIKAQSAIPVLSELARARLLGSGEKVRELAVTTLGQIGSDAAVSVLGEIVRAKTFFGGTPAVRAAATRALGSIDSPAARELLKQH